MSEKIKGNYNLCFVCDSELSTCISYYLVGEECDYCWIDSYITITGVSLGLNLLSTFRSHCLPHLRKVDISLVNTNNFY